MSVNADPESARMRRYLLDDVRDEERTAVEQEYFADERALERMEAAEEELIEDYLAERLEAGERALFERRYMNVPHRRRRAELVRRLVAGRGPAAIASSPAKLRSRTWTSLAAAAALVLAVGGWWMMRRGSSVPAQDGPAVAVTPAPQPNVAPPTPALLVFSISPARVRSAGSRPPLVVPAGTETVRIVLEGDAAVARVERGRARIRTVGGVEVWRGPAEAPRDASAGTAAQIDVPAARLAPDDYLIELFAIDAGGAEREQPSYFLTVRAR